MRESKSQSNMVDAMTDLQLVCLYALEDMTLEVLNDRYFDGGGIMYTKRVIAGYAKPREPMMRVFYNRFPKKYKKMVEEYRKSEYIYGW
jgi:hypothetical protein